MIELLPNFFFKTLMSAVKENTNVIQMLNVEITLDPTAANAKRDFQEMDKRAQVSVDYYSSAILYKSRSVFLSLHKMSIHESFSSNSACLFMCNLFLF